MAISSVSNSTLATNQTNLQKSGTATEQSATKRGGASSDKNNAENKFDDNVALSHSVSVPTSEEINAVRDSSNILDATSAEKLLQKIMNSIMTDSKTAVSAQSNLNPQALQGLLSQH